MTPNQLTEMFRRQAEEYRPGALESLVRNSHMNDLGLSADRLDNLPSRAQADAVIDRFVASLDECCAVTTKGDLCELLVGKAKTYAARALDGLAGDDRLAEVGLPSQEQIDALVTDITNFFAGQQWMDLGLYARDLARDRAPTPM